MIKERSILQDQYFIKAGYVPNSAKLTLETDNNVYWNKERIRTSNYFQYDVYLLAKKLARKSGPINVIDIGCGTANKTMSLLKPIANRLVGIDQASAIALCKKNYPEAEFYADDFENPELDLALLGLRKEFSLIVCADVIEHLLDPDMLINYFASVAKDDALLVISTPERDILNGRDCMMPRNPTHIREWNTNEFANYLSSRGLEVVRQFLIPDQRARLDRKYLKHVLDSLQQQRTTKTCQVAICRFAKGNNFSQQVPQDSTI